jgi:hypothetical protein
VRTTVPIDDDILRAARSPAQPERKPLRQVKCKWASNRLLPQPQDAERSGFPVFEVRSIPRWRSRLLFLVDLATMLVIINKNP